MKFPERMLRVKADSQRDQERWYAAIQAAQHAKTEGYVPLQSKQLESLKMVGRAWQGNLRRGWAVAQRGGGKGELAAGKAPSLFCDAAAAPMHAHAAGRRPWAAAMRPSSSMATRQWLHP